MPTDPLKVLKKRLTPEHYEKLTALNNEKLNRFVAEAVSLCNPETVFVCTDSEADIKYIRQQAIDRREEYPLETPNHTAHFDGYYDLARDKGNTKYLVSPGMDLGPAINSIDRATGLTELRSFMKDIMKGKEMYVRFFSLGPTDSVFSIAAAQITDSAYVAHSEDLLYRPGYEQFKKLQESDDFFRVLHSAGELDEYGCSANLDMRRIYIDLQEDLVYSINTQYAGNTVGFKKLSLRLTIRKAARESWLAEHMLVMGVHGPNDRVTYFTGAFPSFCGKTSTSMVPGETIVGDDIAYLRRINGCINAVNVESGIFGIIQDINPESDPIIWSVLESPHEMIYSNVLVKDNKPYWNGDGRTHPETGRNYSGEWFKGKKDKEGNEIPASHKNARYTIRLSAFPNLDPRANDPEGVPVGGIIYGGRDSDTWVPVQQSFNWGHGVITMGAALESETTAATLGQEGIRSFQPMSNLDFLSIPLKQYIENHIIFAAGLEKPPLIFAVNYFLKDKQGRYYNSIKDKYVWLKWMELRVHNEVGAIRTPTGYIPKYEHLALLFRRVLNKDYDRQDYMKQFTLRVQENLRKIDRIQRIYETQVNDTPKVLVQVLNEQRERLLVAQSKHGNYITPEQFGSD